MEGYCSIYFVFGKELFHYLMGIIETVGIMVVEIFDTFFTDYDWFNICSLSDKLSNTIKEFLAAVFTPWSCQGYSLFAAKLAAFYCICYLVKDCCYFFVSFI